MRKDMVRVTIEETGKEKRRGSCGRPQNQVLGNGWLHEYSQEDGGKQKGALALYICDMFASNCT